MGKFTRVERGKRAREPVSFTTIEGDEQAAAFRPLDGDLEATVLERAQKFAEQKGVKDPRPLHPIYELGYELATLSLAMVDSEVEDKDELFWENVDQIQRFLDRDRIAMLYEQHCYFQDKVSPRRHTLNGIHYLEKVFEVAGAGEDDISPFASMRPGLLKSFTRTMARQLATFLTLRLQDSSSSEPAPPNS